jgi:hypothetical protein
MTLSPSHSRNAPAFARALLYGTLKPVPASYEAVHKTVPNEILCWSARKTALQIEVLDVALLQRVRFSLSSKLRNLPQRLKMDCKSYDFVMTDNVALSPPDEGDAALH